MADFSRTRAALLHGIELGDHLGAQLVVRRSGDVVLDLAVGEVRPGETMRSDHLLPWMSAGKPLTAALVLQLVERGRLRLDDRVADTIGEFAAGGKQAITVRQVLTHTGGFRLVSNNWSAEPWSQIIQRICASQLEPGWVPGERAGYHVASGWFILGELVQRITGRPFDRVVREELLDPLGMADTWIGMPPEQFNNYGGFTGRIAPMYTIDPAPPPAREIPMDASRRQDAADAKMHGAEFVPEKSPATKSVQPKLIARGMVNTELGCTSFRPGANARGPIGELARFYQMLLNGGTLDGARAMGEAMVRQMITRQRIGLMDQTFKRTIDWGLGVIINSRRYGDEALPYGFGPYASDDSFGHGGNQSSCGLADPEHGLVITWICNAMPGEARHDARVRAINAAVYEDLSLSTPRVYGPG